MDTGNKRETLPVDGGHFRGVWVGSVFPAGSLTHTQLQNRKEDGKDSLSSLIIIFQASGICLPNYFPSSSFSFLLLSFYPSLFFPSPLPPTPKFTRRHFLLSTPTCSLYLSLFLSPSISLALHSSLKLSLLLVFPAIIFLFLSLPSSISLTLRFVCLSFFLSLSLFKMAELLPLFWLSEGGGACVCIYVCMYICACVCLFILLKSKATDCPCV